MLVDKSETFVGAGMALRTDRFDELPVALAGLATQVGTVEGQLDGRRAKLLGVDRATFEQVVRWREDASGSSLVDVLDQLVVPPPGEADDDQSVPADDALPTLRAVVVGPTDGGSTFSTRRGPVAAIEQVGSARWFPGFSNGTTLVVVDLDALRGSGLDVRASVWLRDRPLKHSRCSRPPASRRWASTPHARSSTPRATRPSAGRTRPGCVRDHRRMCHVDGTAPRALRRPTCAPVDVDADESDGDAASGRGGGGRHRARDPVGGGGALACCSAGSP